MPKPNYKFEKRKKELAKQKKKEEKRKRKLEKKAELESDQTTTDVQTASEEEIKSDLSEDIKPTEGN